MDLSEIDSELEAIAAEEKETQHSLEELLHKHALVHEQVCNDIFRASDNLRSVSNQAVQLNTTLMETARVADKISKHVRHLDRVKTRVAAVIQRVDDILDLKNCTDGIKIALDNEDYEIAAGHIHRYKALDTNFLKNNANESASIEASIEILENAELQMKKVTRNKFDEAYKAQDVASIERFFKIFPLLGLQREGLSKFVSFLSSQVADATSKNLSMALEFLSSNDRSNVVFSDTFVLLFEGLARVVEVHQPLVETYYGPGHLAQFAMLLQDECNKQSSIIFSQFLKSRNVKAKINGYNSGEIELSAKKADSLLLELTLINERAELYLRFLHRRVLMDSLLACETDSEKEQSRKDVLRSIENCGLTELLHILIGYYLQLETIFLKQSFLLAVEVNIADEGALTSSMVDDAFYVLKKCLRRAVSTTNTNAVCAMINISNALLENEYCHALLEKLKTALPSSYLDMMLTGRYQSDVMAQCKNVFLVSLNNCCQSISFLNTLVDNLSRDWKSLQKDEDFKAAAAADAKVRSCLSDMKSVSKQFDSVLQEGHNSLVKYFLKPLVKNCSENFSLISHNLSDDELVLSETEDPFSQKVIALIDAFIIDIKDLLLPENFELMISNFAQTLMISLEKAIFKMKFSRNGGLAFDREVRTLSNYLSSVTQWSVRDKFLKLSQTAALLNLESVDEVQELGLSSATWRLTPSEIRQVLSLRDDFRSDAIRKLVL